MCECTGGTAFIGVVGEEMNTGDWGKYLTGLGFLPQGRCFRYDQYRVQVHHKSPYLVMWIRGLGDFPNATVSVDLFSVSEYRSDLSAAITDDEAKQVFRAMVYPDEMPLCVGIRAAVPLMSLWGISV